MASIYIYYTRYIYILLRTSLFDRLLQALPVRQALDQHVPVCMSYMIYTWFRVYSHICRYRIKTHTAAEVHHCSSRFLPLRGSVPHPPKNIFRTLQVQTLRTIPCLGMKKQSNSEDKNATPTILDQGGPSVIHNTSIAKKCCPRCCTRMCPVSCEGSAECGGGGVRTSCMHSKAVFLWCSECGLPIWP